MKKLLLIILIGAFIMLKPINAIIKDSIGNIIHRGNVVTGIIATDNGDGSYDVFISEADEAREKVRTLSHNPDLAVKDKVRILYEDGCKEKPIIWPPVTAVAAIPLRYALIVASPNELQLFDMNGVLIGQLPITGWAYSSCDVTADANGNIYIEENTQVIKKFDSDMNLLVTQSIESGSNWIESMNFGNDGYLYTLEGRASGYAVAKRDASDLTIVEDVVTLPSGYYTGGLCLDSDGNFYVIKSSEDIIEKYSGAGAKLAELYLGGSSYNEYAGIGICGSNLYFSRSTSKIYYMPLDLSGYTEWNLPSSICYALTVADGHLILSGWDGDSDGATSKYDSDRNSIWTVKLTAASYAYKAGGYNF